MSALQLALVGANGLFRQGLRMMLEPERFSIIDECRDFASIDAHIQSGSTLDLVVLDLSGFPDHNFENIQRLHTRHRDIRIVVLTNELSLKEMAGALKAGADGYLVNELSSEAFSLCLLLVMAGQKILPSSLVDVFAKGLDGNGLLTNAPKTLTDREQEILTCLLNGQSNKHIARALDISEGTVKVHLKSLMKKIEVCNRTQAALWARNHGMGNGIEQHLLS